MTSYNLAVAALREQAAALDLSLETQMTDDYGNMVKEASGAIVGAAKAMKQINIIKKSHVNLRGFDPQLARLRLPLATRIWQGSACPSHY